MLQCSLYESLIVNEFINDLPGPSLLPVDPVARAQARLIIDQVSAACRSAQHSTAQHSTAQHSTAWL
jgi:glutathione S-transferase